MDVIDVVSRVGSIPLKQYSFGVKLVKRINDNLTPDRHLNIEDVTGSDVMDLFYSSSQDFRTRLLNIDVSDIRFEKKPIYSTHFPYVPAVWFSFCLLIISLLFMVVYSFEANKNGYLPTDTVFVRTIRWITDSSSQ